MTTETTADANGTAIESIDISPMNLAIVLSRIGADASSTMVMVGEGPNQTAVPASEGNYVLDEQNTFDGEKLAEDDGGIADEITVNGQSVQVNVV